MDQAGGRTVSKTVRFFLAEGDPMIDLEGEIVGDVDGDRMDLGLAQLTAPELAREIAKLRRYLVNYEEFLQSACLALLLGKHLYLYGAPGTAKSQACRMLADSLCNCRHFETQVKDQTTLEHLVGAVIAEEYLHSGRQVYNLEGGLAAVEIAVLSELPDGEPGHIKSLADLLEDRRFYTKDVQVISPLHTLLASGNWLPAGKQWEPILDRFGFIQRSPQPHGAHERANVLHAVQEIRAGPDLPRINFTALATLSRRILALEVPAGIEMAAAWVVDQHEINQHHAPRLALRPMSPRRLRDALDTIRATAALAGASRVAYEHLTGLVPALTVGGGAGGEDEEAERIHAEQAAVRALVHQVLPQNTEERMLLDRLGELHNDLREWSLRPETSEWRLTSVGRWLKKTELVARSRLMTWLQEMHGRLGDVPARQMAADLRESARKINGTGR
jgi:MoxR-like ATPase